MENLTIGEIARRAGVPTSTIRYYESLGLLPEPARASGQRRYSDQILRELHLIRVAQRAGFTLGEIKHLMDGFSYDTPPVTLWRRMADQKLAEVELAIQKAIETKTLLEAAVNCQCTRLEDCHLLAQG